MATPTFAADAARRDDRRWWALGAISLAVLAVGLDGTVLSVALPTLARRLHAGESDLQWFSSGYLLVLATSVLPAGLVGDRLGRRRVMLIALVLFALGSVGCAASTTPGSFIAARALLGVAGAGIIVMALSALAVLFDEDERPKAVGVWSAANFLALPIGPILGGWMLGHIWWGWVFLLNVPVALIGLIAVFRLVPESRAAERPLLDAVGIGLSAIGLLLLTYGFIEAGQHGWGHVGALAPITGGVLLLGGFLAWERRCLRHRVTPLVDPRLFRSASFTWGVLLAAVVVLAFVGVLFTMPQYFQGVAGVDATDSGLRLVPLILGLVAGALPADRLARRLGAKLAATLGFVLLAGGLFLGTGTASTSSVLFVGGWMALAGAGVGLTTATAAAAALSELSADESGIGSAVFQAANKTGAPLGTAVIGSVASAVYLSHLHLSGWPAAVVATARESIFGAASVAAQAHAPGLLHSAREAFVQGMGASLLVSGAIALVGALLALLFLPAARDTAPAQPDLSPVRRDGPIAV
jgi:DHA2 family multidrug resistance protein-like MFS transporter